MTVDETGRHAYDEEQGARNGRDTLFTYGNILGYDDYQLRLPCRELQELGQAERVDKNKIYHYT